MQLLFERALLPQGIARQVAVTIEQGRIRTLVPNCADAAGGLARVPGLALIGMPNLHSHAFQRGIAGATEVAVSRDSSFWSWRDVMYRFVGRLQPDDVAALAAFVYVEMLEAGYTSVAEFHYLHHQGDGTPYQAADALAVAVREGARRAGIRQLLLPCLYQRSGFRADGPAAEQRRFAHRTGAFLDLLQLLRRTETPLQRTGIAVHSLRAVSIPAIADVVAAVPAQLPKHIHIAEQRREVAECMEACGRTPIDLLLDSIAVDRHWCLVHATHATDTELTAMARRAAVVGLCITTESNLGDGRFALDEFLARGGVFGIGSDSQVSIDPREELRGAEYVMRLWRERRGLLASSEQPHCGTYLYSAAAGGGAQALGLGAGALRTDADADLVVIDTDRAEFAGVTDEALLDAYIFAPRAGALRDVMVGGEWVIRAGRHPLRDTIARQYREAMQRQTTA